MLKKQAVANEIAASMRENLKPKSCPTTPDKIAEALDKLTLAAQLFDTIGRTKYASGVDAVIFNLQKKLITLANSEPSMPIEVKRVVDFAKQSEQLSRNEFKTFHGDYIPPDYKKSRVYAAEENGKWVVCDNYERIPLLLEYQKGYWTFRYINRDMRPIKISQKEAEANARLMFADAKDDQFIEPEIQLKEKDPSEGLLDSEFDDRFTDEPSSPMDEYEDMEYSEHERDYEEPKQYEPMPHPDDRWRD